MAKPREIRFWEALILARHWKCGGVKGPYLQKSVRRRIEALFLDNIGKIITRAQILEVAKNPQTQEIPENWHQRLSELRTDAGYTILSARDRSGLGVSEYVLVTAKRMAKASDRIKPAEATWAAVLERCKHTCEWEEGGVRCDLAEGVIDPVGGGTVRLTPDHRTPHSMDPAADPSNPDAWNALCGRHQVMKKNYWDDSTGRLNMIAIVQSASTKDKRAVYEFLKKYYGEEQPEPGRVSLLEMVRYSSDEQKSIIFEFLTEYFSQR